MRPIWPAAANRVVELGGGIVVWDGGAPKAEVPLSIAGIMSDEPLITVNEKLEAAKDAAYALGVNPGIDPFMTLSFMALPVIPTLRITTGASLTSRSRPTYNRENGELPFSTGGPGRFKKQSAGFGMIPNPALFLFSFNPLRLHAPR